MDSKAEPHLRHPHPLHHGNVGEEESHEGHPLIRHFSIGEGHARHLMRHFSMEDTVKDPQLRVQIMKQYTKRFFVIVAVFITAFILSRAVLHPSQSKVIPIEHAQEHWLEVDDGITLWFRTWGRRDGIPILFVHGGPGQAVADYNNGNKRFFDATKCFVVEVDQRGAGNSKPSVRDDWRNMEYYSDISIDLIGRDFEVIREYLGIDQWVVWGGSFGSTVGLNYAMLYPESSMTLILRGIYLDTAREVQSVYSRNAFKDNPKRLKQFQQFFAVAAANFGGAEDEALDPNDAFNILTVYERMIINGDRNAIWNWHAFEVNLMEEDKKNMLDPEKIDEAKFREAQSVAFFETRLWLHGSYEEPSNLLKRVETLSDIPIWICQGLRDEVCPPENAQHLVNALEETEGSLTANFINSGHEDTDPVMEECLKKSVRQFLKLNERHYFKEGHKE